MKTGLVMEGGAMRGMFTCGVIDVFMENGIDFDAAVGISAGAAFGCNIKSRQIGRAIRYNKRFCKDPRFASFRSLIKTGDLYGADFCYRAIPDELDIFDRDAFKSNPMHFYVGALNCETGKTIYHDCKDGEEVDLKWIRASASMPLVSKIVEVDGYKLLDGGMCDSIPYEFIENEGYEKNVVILTQPKGYVKKSNKLAPLAKLMISDYPNVAKAMKERHIRYNEQTKLVEQREMEGKAYVIRPDEPLDIGKMEKDPVELERVYQLGRMQGINHLERIKKFLEIH